MQTQYDAMQVCFFDVCKNEVWEKGGFEKYLVGRIRHDMTIEGIGAAGIDFGLPFHFA